MFLVIAPGWGQLLEENGLDTFETLWNLERDWVEQPNERRGGWSGVVRRRLGEGEQSTVLFIKRQEGQNRRTLRHPFRGRPTYYLEYRFLRRHGEQFPQLVSWACYGESRAGPKDRAVLATAGLTNYLDLNEIHQSVPRQALEAILQEVARAVLPLHLKHLQHGALYAVHVFVHADTREVKLIDTERARFRTRRRAAALADLSQFVRRTEWLDAELFRIFLQPWEEQFPGISRQLPQPGQSKKDS
jgi:hypothetical protein